MLHTPAKFSQSTVKWLTVRTAVPMGTAGGEREDREFLLPYQLIALGDESAHVDPAVSIDAWEGLPVDHKLCWGGIDLCALPVS